MKKFYLAMIGLILGTIWPSVAQAAGGGFVISPAFQDLNLSASAVELPVAVGLSNHTAIDQSFRLSVADFGSLDEEGGVAFLGQPASELDHRYGLASWIVLEKDLVFVPAGQSVQLHATIQNRASLSPGGHYGAILATAVSDSGQPYVGDPRVGVKEVVSSLIMLTKSGGADPRLQLVHQTANTHTWKLPTTAELRFQNSGNLHLVPRGIVTVKDPAGQVVERGPIDPDSGVILPESFRRYQVDFLNVGKAWLPGRYQVVSTYRYDGTDQTQTLVTSFWYAGAIVIWPVILVGLILVAALLWFVILRPRFRASRKGIKS